MTVAVEPLPLGLQLYTVNDQLAAHFIGTLAKAAEIGLSSVELAGFDGRGASQIAQDLADGGLICRSAHIPAQSIGDGPSLDGDLDLLADAVHLNDKGHALASRGLRIVCHNQNFKFAPVGGGTALDFLLASS